MSENYWDRVNFQQITEFILHGVECIKQDPRPLQERLYQNNSDFVKSLHEYSKQIQKSDWNGLSEEERIAQNEDIYTEAGVNNFTRTRSILHLKWDCVLACIYRSSLIFRRKDDSMAYAEKTTVSVAKTKADIEELIQKYGADQFISGYRGDLAVIGFSMADRQIRFILPLPEKKDFMYTPGRNQRRSDDAARTAWEQACRSKWRSLYLVIKAKMEAVDTGISTIEREFLSNIVLPDGQTVGEWMAPQLETAYTQGNMPALLPMLEDCNQNG